MSRFMKWLIVPVVLVGAFLVAAPQEASAGGWGISFYGGSPSFYYGNGGGYGGGYGNYGYRSYNPYYSNNYYRGNYGGGYGNYYGGGHHHCR